jgi:hypothetical protein
VIAENLYTGANTIQAQAVCASGPGVTALVATTNTKSFEDVLAQAKADSNLALAALTTLPESGQCLGGARADRSSGATAGFR